jgi:glutathione-regulated potassium-efflux system protein KefB
MTTVAGLAVPDWPNSYGYNMFLFPPRFWVGNIFYEHTHRLMDAGVQVIRRETFLSSLDLTRELLRGLGLPERDVRFAVETFKEQDRRRLYEDYKHYTDIEKMQNRAKTYTQELQELFEKDAAEQAKRAREAEEGGEEKSRAGEKPTPVS